MMAKEELREALHAVDGRWWASGLLAAARFVERLLPGECEKCGGIGEMLGHSAGKTERLGPCSSCHGTGQLWDEGLVEVVARAIYDADIVEGVPSMGVRRIYQAMASGALAALVGEVNRVAN